MNATKEQAGCNCCDGCECYKDGQKCPCDGKKDGGCQCCSKCNCKGKETCCSKKDNTKACCCNMKKD